MLFQGRRQITFGAIFYVFPAHFGFPNQAKLGPKPIFLMALRVYFSICYEHPTFCWILGVFQYSPTLNLLLPSRRDANFNPMALFALDVTTPRNFSQTTCISRRSNASKPPKTDDKNKPDLNRGKLVQNETRKLCLRLRKTCLGLHFGGILWTWCDF